MRLSRRTITLWLLAAAVFAATLGSALVPGILPVFHAESGIPVADIGRSNAVFGAAYAIAAPTIAFLARRRDPFQVLCVALPATALAVVAVALAGTTLALDAARAFQAVTVAGVVPMCTVHAGTIVTTERRSRALSVVFTGMVVSSLIGAPLGNALAPAIGARWTVLIAAGLAVGVVLALVKARAWQGQLREVEGESAAAASVAGGAVGIGAVVILAGTLGTALLESAATSSLGTFISPLLTSHLGATGAGLSALMLCYGIAGLVGNSVLGRTADALGPATVLVALQIVAAGAIVAIPFVHEPWAVAGLLLVWGFSSWGINPALQALILAHGGRHLRVLVGVNSSLIYTGSALGAAVASGVVAGHGVTPLPAVSAGIFVLATLTASVAFVAVARQRHDAGSGEGESADAASAGKSLSTSPSPSEVSAS